MATYDPVEFGKRVRKLRKSFDMTQKELADELNITRQHLSWLESGRGCSANILVELASYFNVSIDYLIFGEEPDWAGSMKERLMVVVNELLEIARLLQ